MEACLWVYRGRRRVPPLGINGLGILLRMSRLASQLQLESSVRLVSADFTIDTSAKQPRDQTDSLGGTAILDGGRELRSDRPAARRHPVVRRSVSSRSLDQLHRFVPAEAGIRDALAVCDRIILPAADEVALEHHTDEPLFSVLSLGQHALQAVDLAGRILAAVAVTAVHHDPGFETTRL